MFFCVPRMKMTSRLFVSFRLTFLYFFFCVWNDIVAKYVFPAAIINEFSRLRNTGNSVHRKACNVYSAIKAIHASMQYATRFPLPSPERSFLRSHVYSSLISLPWLRGTSVHLSVSQLEMLLHFVGRDGRY